MRPLGASATLQRTAFQRLARRAQLAAAARRERYPKLEMCRRETQEQLLPARRPRLGQTKDTSYWRWEMEHESAINKPRAKQFV